MKIVVHCVRELKQRKTATRKYSSRNIINKLNRQSCKRIRPPQREKNGNKNRRNKCECVFFYFFFLFFFCHILYSFWHVAFCLSLHKSDLDGNQHILVALRTFPFSLCVRMFVCVCVQVRDCSSVGFGFGFWIQIRFIALRILSYNTISNKWYGLHTRIPDEFVCVCVLVCAWCHPHRWQGMNSFRIVYTPTMVECVSLFRIAFFPPLHRRTLSDNFNYLIDGIWWVEKAERSWKWKENVCHYSICPKHVEKSMQCDGFSFLIKLAGDRFYHNSISNCECDGTNTFSGKFRRITSESETRNSRNKNHSTIFLLLLLLSKWMAEIQVEANDSAFALKWRMCCRRGRRFGGCAWPGHVTGCITSVVGSCIKATGGFFPSLSAFYINFQFFNSAPTARIGCIFRFCHFRSRRCGFCGRKQTSHTFA